MFWYGFTISPECADYPPTGLGAEIGDGATNTAYILAQVIVQMLLPKWRQFYVLPIHRFDIMDYHSSYAHIGSWRSPAVAIPFLYH